MAIKGTATIQNSEGGFKKYVGLAVVEIVAINPTSEKIEELSGKKPEEDPSYTDVDDKGNDKVNFVIWTKEESTGKIFSNLKINVTDKPRPISRTGQYQYINNIGFTSWAKSEDGLKANFAKRPHRLAKVGEENFYDFMGKWLCLGGDDAELEFNLTKLLRGNFRELDETVKNFLGQKVVVLFTVNTRKNKEDELVEFQNIYPFGFLPYETISGKTLDFFKVEDNKKPAYVEYFVKKVTDSTFGCKDFFKLAPLQVYNPSENFLTTDQPIKKEKEVEATYNPSENTDGDPPF